ncbi:MAG: hypothetical protein CMJ31_08665 [Phycisphaerae bacterium]|nr:hypothetical protein [Phycisphaerae bacterium]
MQSVVSRGAALAIAVIAVLSSRAVANETPATTLPITEVTAFKDGHALVLRSGRTPYDPSDEIVLSELPTPVLGTFWAQYEGVEAKVASVRVERLEADSTRDVASIADILRANVGRRIGFRLAGDDRDALREGELKQITDSSGAPIVLVREDDALAAVPLSEMRDVRIVGEDIATTLTDRSPRDRMVIELERRRGIHSDASVSLMYLQRGLRWIPSYRITMLDDERVRLELQASLVNELDDLENATVHMAVGVPSFQFEHQIDPMALRESFDSLGLFFREARVGQTGSMFSNAIMSQLVDSRARQPGGAIDAAPDATPEMTGGERAEDLFVYTVEGVTLRKGARMTLPITSFECSYESLYELELDAAPPELALRSLNDDHRRAIAVALLKPVAKHALRIENTHPEGHPPTTAPALVIRDGRVLAQGMVTYAARGATTDVEVGSAIDIQVERSESELGRDHNAVRWNGHDYARVDIGMNASLTNRKSHPVRVEAHAVAFGIGDSVSNGGERKALNVYTAEAAWAAPLRQRLGWPTLYWPGYWSRLNGAAEFEWDVEIQPGETIDLEAAWHYFWM